MIEEAEVTKQVSPEMEQKAAQRARNRAKAARWDLDVALFLFAILTIIIILSSQGIVIEIVAPIAFFGLAMAWLMGWRRGRRLYPLYYNEEISKLEQEPKKTVEEMVEETVEETIEEQVRKALRARWQ